MQCFIQEIISLLLLFIAALLHVGQLLLLSVAKPPSNVREHKINIMDARILEHR